MTCPKSTTGKNGGEGEGGKEHEADVGPAAEVEAAPEEAADVVVAAAQATSQAEDARTSFPFEK